MLSRTPDLYSSCGRLAGTQPNLCPFFFSFASLLTFGFLSLHVCVCVRARAFVHVHVYMKGRAQLFSWHHPPHRSSTDQRSIWTAAASTCALAAHIFNLYTSQRTAVTAPLRVICSLPVCAVVRLPKSNGPRETAHTDDEQHCSTPMTSSIAAHR